MDLTARLRLIDDGFSSRMRSATQSLGEVEKRTRSLSSGFKNLTTTMGGMAGAIGVTSLLSKGLNTLKGSFSTAFDRIDTMEQATRTLNVMVGDVDKVTAALESTREAVTGTAYTLDGAAASVQRFVTSGTDINKAVGYVESWGDAVAFYGDGSQETFDSVADSLSKMLSAGKVGGDQLNRLLHANIPVLDIFAEATGKSTAEVQKALSKGTISAETFVDTLTEAYQKGGDKFPSIANAAKEAGASWGSVFGNVRTRIASGVEDIIKTIDEMLEDNGLPDMRSMVASFGDAVRDSLVKVSTYVRPAAAGFKRLYQAIKPAIPIIKQVATAVGIAVAAVGGFFAVVGVFKLIGAGLMFLTSPIGLVIGGITALVLGFQHFYKSSEPFRKAIDGIIGAVKGLYFAFTDGDVEQTMDIFKKAGLDEAQIAKVVTFGKSLKGAFDKVKGVFDAIPKIFNREHKASIDILAAAGFSNKQSAVIREFGYGLKDAFDRMKEIFSGLGTTLSGGGATDLLKALGFSPESIAHITSFAENVKTRASELVTFLGAKWADLQPGITTLIGAFITAKDTIGEIFTTLLSILSPIFDALVNAFKIVADVAVMVFDNIIAPGIGFVISMFQLLWKVVGPILELLGAAIGVAFGILKVVWDTILKPVAAWFMGAFKEAFEQAKPHVDTIGEAFSTFGGFVSGVTDKLRTFSNFLKNIKIPDWVSDIGGKIAGAASWVSNAVNGGNGKSNYHGNDRIPYDGYMARLHRGERILTRQEADAMDHVTYEAASSGSTTYNNQTYNNVSTTQVSGEKGGNGGGVTVTGNTFHVRQESDIDDIAEQLYRKIYDAGEAGA